MKPAVQFLSTISVLLKKNPSYFLVLKF